MNVAAHTPHAPLGVWLELVFMNMYKMFIILSVNRQHFLSREQTFSHINMNKEVMFAGRDAVNSTYLVSKCAAGPWLHVGL